MQRENITTTAAGVIETPTKHRRADCTWETATLMKSKSKQQNGIE